MTGEAQWLSLAIVLMGALPIAYLWLEDWRAERRYLVERRRVRCRGKDNQLVECTLVCDARTREAIGIRNCSAQAMSGVVTCDKVCLPLFAPAS